MTKEARVTVNLLPVVRVVHRVVMIDGVGKCAAESFIGACNLIGR